MRHIRICVMLASAALFAVAHLFFLRTYLYWEFGLLDIFMHVWGGILIIVAWYELIPSLRSWPVSRLAPLCALLILAFSWEVFKYLIGGTVADNYARDTVTDIVAGLGGGLAAFYAYRSRTIGS
jgi:hypothetical protein